MVTCQVRHSVPNQYLQSVINVPQLSGTNQVAVWQLVLLCEKAHLVSQLPSNPNDVRLLAMALAVELTWPNNCCGHYFFVTEKTKLKKTLVLRLNL